MFSCQIKYQCFILSSNCSACLHFASKKYIFFMFPTRFSALWWDPVDTPQCRFSPQPTNENSCWFHLTLTHTKTQWLNERLYFHIYKSNSLLHQITPVFFPNCCCDFHKINYNFTKWGEFEGSYRGMRSKAKNKRPINDNNNKIIVIKFQEIYENHSTSLISVIYISTKRRVEQLIKGYHGFIWNN